MILCKRDLDHQAKGCVFVAKHIHVNKALSLVLYSKKIGNDSDQFICTDDFVDLQKIKLRQCPEDQERKMKRIVENDYGTIASSMLK